MESIKKFLKSFVYAFNGFKVVVKERNFKFHLLIAFLVVILGFVFNLSQSEFAILILTISAVLVAETFNTVIEKVCDIIRDRLNLDYEATKIPRDIAAFAVLITAICSVILGLIIFFF